MNKYKCNTCGKIVLRDSSKQWINSTCAATGIKSRLYLLTQTKNA